MIIVPSFQLLSGMLSDSDLILWSRLSTLAMTLSEQEFLVKVTTKHCHGAMCLSLSSESSFHSGNTLDQRGKL